MTRHDSYSCALDFIAFEQDGAESNFGNNMEGDTVYLAYKELKGNKPLTNELKKVYGR